MARIYFLSTIVYLVFPVAKLACYVNADPKSPVCRRWKTEVRRIDASVSNDTNRNLVPKVFSRFSTCRLVKNQGYPAQEVAQDAHNNLSEPLIVISNHSFFIYIFFFSRPDVLWACRVTCEVTCCVKSITGVPYPSPIGQ